MSGLRLTDRGWVALWIVFAAAMIALTFLVDAYVLDLTPTEQEMESLR